VLENRLKSENNYRIIKEILLFKIIPTKLSDFRTQKETILDGY
jgi:hypothetical protein